MNWPPPICVRYSHRAKRANLKLSAQKGLEVILPKNFDIRSVLPMVDEHRHWIETTQKRLQINLFQLHSKHNILPDTIKLAALEQVWQIHYQSQLGYRLKLQKKLDNILLITGPIENKVAVKNLLLKWLKKEAEKYLSSLLAQLSQLHGLPYKRMSIRHSKGRWGSCSPEKNIMLSSQLLFLPIELVRHVILHELAHTKYLHHQRQFWNLLKNLDPHSLSSRQQLKLAQHFIPEWYS